MALTPEQKEFLRAFERMLKENARAMEQINETFRATAAAMERLAFPERTVTLGGSPHDCDPCRHLSGMDVVPCGLLPNDPIHSGTFVGGHPFVP